MFLFRDIGDSSRCEYRIDWLRSVVKQASSSKNFTNFLEPHTFNFVNFIFYFRDHSTQFFRFEKSFEESFIDIFSSSPRIHKVDRVVEEMDKFLCVAFTFCNVFYCWHHTTFGSGPTIEIRKKVVYQIRFAILLRTLNLFFHILLPLSPLSFDDGCLRPYGYHLFGPILDLGSCRKIHLMGHWS